VVGQTTDVGTNGLKTFPSWPGEPTPVAHYAFVQSSVRWGDKRESLFACVLATTAVLEDLANYPPHVVFETASLQGIGGDATDAAIEAGLTSWVQRVFPEHSVPAFEVIRWSVSGASHAD